MEMTKPTTAKTKVHGIDISLTKEEEDMLAFLCDKFESNESDLICGLIEIFYKFIVFKSGGDELGTNT